MGGEKDHSARRLAESQTDTAGSGPLDVKMVAHVRRIRDAIASTSPARLLDSEFLADALSTLKYACDTFIGWHGRIEHPPEVEAKLNGGAATVCAYFPDGSQAEFELSGTRWRRRGGPNCSALEVALGVGQPISYINGIEKAFSAIKFVIRNGRDTAGARPEFSDTESVARSIGVPVGVVEGWVAAQLVPFYLLPGSEQPWLKLPEIKKRLTEIQKKCGNLEPAYRIEVIAKTEICPTTPHYEIPHAIRNISGLKQIQSHASVSGIYFLCLDGEVVYVGQSISVLGRVGQHSAEGIKQFNQVFFFPCPPDQLDTTERQLIDSLLPKYNGDSATKSRRRAAELMAQPSPTEVRSA